MANICSINSERKMRQCLVPTCKGARFDLVHKFPMDNERAEQWRSTLNVAELYDFTLDHLRKRYFVCSKHFRKEDYKNCESRSLNKTAYPRLHLTAESDDALPPAAKFVLGHSSPTSIDLEQTQLQLSHPECESDAQTKENVNNERQLRKMVPSPKVIRVIRKMAVQGDSPRNLTKMFQKSQCLDKSSSMDQCLEEVSMDNDPMASKRVGLQLQPAVEVTKRRKVHFAKLNVTKDPKLNLVVDNQHLPNIKLDSFNMAFQTRATNVEKSFNEHRVTEMRSFVEMDEEFLQINSHQALTEPLVLSYFWLRDHCRCDECYAHDTYQRRLNLLDIPIDIKPTETNIQENELRIKWADGHESTYNIIELANSQYEKVKQRFTTTQAPILWRKADIEAAGYARVSFLDYLNDKETAKSVVESLVKYGVAFIENVPPTEECTEVTIKHLFPIQKTFFGEMWSFTNEKVHSDSAYTQEYLGAHNDNTYFNDAAGLQILHCIKYSGTGGDNFLVDGFRAVTDLRESNGKAYDTMCNTSIPAEYVEQGRHHVHCDSIIRLNPITNEPEQLRFNLYDRAPFNSIPQAKIPEFYKALRELATHIQSPTNEWWFKLDPGTVCIFDNWRLLHGRGAYKGIRKMVGSYVSRTEFMSVARTLGLIN